MACLPLLKLPGEPAGLRYVHVQASLKFNGFAGIHQNTFVGDGATSAVL